MTGLSWTERPCSSSDNDRILSERVSSPSRKVRIPQEGVFISSLNSILYLSPHYFVICGMLFIVPTPVGNLEDMTFRSIRMLKEADLILAEDTRTTGFLLKHYGIETPMRSYHMHNEHKIVEGVAAELAGGRTMALVTDAGTPGISDPGFLLIREASKQGVEIQCLPGATAFVPALVDSGIPCDRFTFEGFLPPKKGRQTRLTGLRDETRTMVLYESPHKLLRTLSDLSEHLGADRQASVSREISKKFEETLRGSLQELHTHFEQNSPKGEFVLVVSGKQN